MEIQILEFTARCAWPSAAACSLAISTSATKKQGTCTNACRWQYNVQEGKKRQRRQHRTQVRADSGDKMLSRRWDPATNRQSVYDSRGPASGEADQPRSKTQHGTQHHELKICAIAHVERLTKMGVHSLKSKVVPNL
ncbi:U32 family peptidase [Escherichia coli]